MRTIILVLPACLFLVVCGMNKDEKQLCQFITDRVEQIRPLAKEANLANWRASTTGEAQAFATASQLSLKEKQIYCNPNDFAFLSKMKKQGHIHDRLLARQMQLLYNTYLENQMEPELLKQITELSSLIEQKFSTFRGSIGTKRVTVNEINDILKNDSNGKNRQDAWMASKMVGPLVAADIIALVKLRNESARKLGFDNYHTLSLSVNEQDVAELDHIFQSLYELTNAPFAQIKAELDTKLAERYGISAADIKPWHYHDPFFQEAPLMQAVDLDKFYKDKDVKELGLVFFKAIDLPVESIVANSDLYEREGKNPHAFSIDIDREGDVRILCNLQNDERWMGTILHELGHGVYDKYHDAKLPYLLRRPAHAFTTEAIANLFGRLSRNPAWMQPMLGLTDSERREVEGVSSQYARMQMLVFARWSMVMYHFEKQLYANPDQDLNELWWQLAEKYQFIKKPDGRREPDWAAKIHIAMYPCYYHNYQLGELLASQLHVHIVKQFYAKSPSQDAGYVNEKEVGEFLREKVFKVAAAYHWNEVIKRATGEPLTAKYFVEQFVKL